jgi:hypothetical protein
MKLHPITKWNVCIKLNTVIQEASSALLELSDPSTVNNSEIRLEKNLMIILNQVEDFKKVVNALREKKK